MKTRNLLQPFYYVTGSCAKFGIHFSRRITHYYVKSLTFKVKVDVVMHSDPPLLNYSGQLFCYIQIINDSDINKMSLFSKFDAVNDMHFNSNCGDFVTEVGLKSTLLHPETRYRYYMHKRCTPYFVYFTRATTQQSRNIVNYLKDNRQIYYQLNVTLDEAENCNQGQFVDCNVREVSHDVFCLQSSEALRCYPTN